MVLKPDQERVKTLLQDTITLLCRNGLNYKSEFNVNALIGITLDKDEVFLVDIRETVKNKGDEESGEDASNDVTASIVEPESPKSPGSGRKKNKKKRNRSQSGLSDAESVTSDSVSGTPNIKQMKPDAEDDDSDDAIIIKDEPGYDQNSYGQQNDILGELSQQGQLYAAPSSLSGTSSWDSPSQQTSQVSQRSIATASLPSSSAPQQKWYMHPEVTTRTSPRARPPAGIAMASPIVVTPTAGKRGRPRKHAPPSESRTTTPNSTPGTPESKNFKCTECNKTFSSNLGLKYHMDRHRGKYPYNCPYCRKGMHSTTNLKGHVKTEHGGSGLGLTCIYCMKDFPFVQGLTEHIRGCESRPLGATAGLIDDECNPPFTEPTAEARDSSSGVVANSSVDISKIYEGRAGSTSVETTRSASEEITIVQPTAPEESPNYTDFAGDFAFELGERAKKQMQFLANSEAEKSKKCPNGGGDVNVLHTITSVEDENDDLQENVDYTIEVRSQGSQDSSSDKDE